MRAWCAVDSAIGGGRRALGGMRAKKGENKINKKGEQCFSQQCFAYAADNNMRHATAGTLVWLLALN